MKIIKHRKCNMVRQILIDTAINLFCIHGIDGASTGMIAKAAGKAQPIIAYYFKNKTTLVIECLKILVNKAINNTLSDQQIILLLFSLEGSYKRIILNIMLDKDVQPGFVSELKRRLK